MSDTTDRHERTVALALLGAGVAWNLALLFPQVLHPEPFLNDSVLHFGLIQALSSAPERGQSLLDPWVGTWDLGFPVFHYYQNLPHLMVLVLWKLSFGALSLVRAFKIVEWLAVGTLAIPVFLAVRRLGFGRAAAVAAGTLSLWIKTDYLHGLDFESYTWQGLGQYTQAVGGWFLPLGIAWTVTALRDGRGYAMATLLMTVTFLCHLALGYMAFMAAGLYALMTPREIPRRLARLALVTVVSVAASGWVVVPILRDFAWYNVSTLVPSWKYNSFGAPIVLERLVRGELFDFERVPVMTLLVAAGVALAGGRAITELVRSCAVRLRTGRFGPAARRENERYLFTLFVFFLALYFGRPTWGSLLDLLPLGSGFHYSRAIYLVHAIGAILAGIALGDVVDALRRRSRPAAAAAAVVVLLVATPLITERTRYLAHNGELVREAAAGLAAEGDDLEAALSLAREDRDGRVYAGQGRAGGPSWGGQFQVGWTPVYSWFPLREMDALGYLHHMWSLNADMHDSFDERNPTHYRVFNVRRIIAPAGSPLPPFAREIASFGRFRVLAVDGPGFVELVDSPFSMNVPKRNATNVHRRWLRTRMPAEGLHPTIRLLEAGDAIEGAVVADGFDVRFPPISPPAAPPGEVLGVDRNGDDFLAHVRVDRAAHLLLKMSYHPGWRALVDGEPAETVHLMPSYVGVALVPGEHEVELRWDPGAAKTVLLIAGLTVLGGLFLVERRLRF